LEEFASSLPGGGEHRPGQLEMAERVSRAIEEDRHLVVQAGTGTGKSLAYLLPAVQSGRRVVVATATQALQHQLAEKDLPFLAAQSRTRRDFTFAVLKGRSNYLCRQRVSEGTGTDANLQMFQEGAEHDRFGSQVGRILEWGGHSDSGDRAELDFEPHPRVWAALSVGARECPGAFRCPSGPLCFAEKARSLAAASDVVVVNTHLYATDVASDGNVLPDHEVVIFDEAHTVEDVMTAGLGVELSAGRLRAVASAGRLRAVASAGRSLLGTGDSELTEALSETADRLHKALRPLSGMRVLRSRAEPEPVDVAVSDDDLKSILGLAHGRLEALVRALRQSGDEEGGRLTRVLMSAGRLIEDLSQLQSHDDDHVAWVEATGQGGELPLLRLAPVEIGPVLAARLWPRVTAVLTSATIPLQIEQTLGLPRSGTDRLDLESPFPYESCALLYCPTDLPDRRDPVSELALHDELHELILAAGGRTLALFTSWRVMQGAVEALRPLLGFTLLAQNDLPKTKLLEAFNHEESACLFATMSFWQGVDVPGTTLSVVAIDRLPFPRPDDPLVQARRERAGERAFWLVDLPRAATFLAQGVGRLIRSSRDSGLVAVLDRRLATASYGRALRAALPPMRFTTQRAEAIAFLGRITKDATGQ
jgi:ATP-dependent DNA helicase DinG